MGRHPLRGRMQGFSLAEMLVVIAILGILAALAAPNMGAMIRTQRIKTAAFDVFSSLTYARSEAIKRNTSVTIEPKTGGWSKGWTIKDANARELRDQTGWDTLDVTGPVSVTFQSSGRLSAPVAPFALSASDVQATALRCVRLDLSGRAVSKEGACS